MPKDSQPTGVVKCHLCHSRGRPEWRKTQSGTQRTLSPSTRQGTQQWVAWCSAQIVSTTYHVSAIFCHTSPFVVTLAPHKGNYAGVQWNGMTLILIQITLLPFIILSGKCWWRGLQNHPMAIYHKSKPQVRTYHPVTTNKGGGREVPGPPWRVIRISHTVLQAQTLWMLWNYLWTVCGLGRTIWESVGTQLHFFSLKLTERKIPSYCGWTD